MLEALEWIFYGIPELIIDQLESVWISFGWRPVVLATDLLIYVLLLGGLFWFYKAMQREYWRAAYRQVRTNWVAMLSLGILLLYVGVGLLDTLHYRKVTSENTKGGSIQSVLDLACKPLLDTTEKTYSAPLATHSFSKENMTLPNGTKGRAFPRLDHGGTHLQNSAERSSDVNARFLKALAVGFGFGLLALLCSAGYLHLTGRLKQMLGDKTKFWLLGIAGYLTFVGTLFGFIVFLGIDYHLFGTDKAGTDVLYIALKGVRTGLIIGTVTTLIVTPFAILAGVCAGYFGGWIDDLIQYVYTTLSSIPFILLVIALMLILQVGLKKEEAFITADKRLFYLCLILGVTSWTGLCRLLRAETLKLRELEYVQAAKAFGVKQWVIIGRHLVPNILHIVLISVVLRFSGLVLAEAVLAYIGIGVDPTTYSWGNMINQARLELARDPVVWWSLVTAFVFMLGLVLPANLFGDAVRDALDPRLRTR